MTSIEDLAQAIENKDSNTVRTLIASGSIDINGTVHRPDGYAVNRTLLILAGGNVEIVEILLSAGANIDGVDDRGQTACHVAANYGFVKVLKLLIARGANLGLRDDSGRTPFEIALFESDLVPNTEKVVVALAEAAGAVDWHDADVQFSLASVNTKCIQMLLDRGIVVGRLRDSEGQTALHAASAGYNQRCPDTMNMLVNVCGVGLDVRDSIGRTACHCASESTSADELRWLIAAGADSDVADNEGRTPLHGACFIHDDEEGVLLLLAAGASVDARITADGKTALHKALDVDTDGWMSTVVHSLIAAGANLDAPDLGGVTARQMLAQQSDNDVDEDDVECARRKIVKTRLDFVRHRALQVCIGLQSLHLDALQMCEILQHACGPVAPLVAFHHWWAIATTVKHFHQRKA